MKILIIGERPHQLECTGMICDVGLEGDDLKAVAEETADAGMTLVFV